MDKWVNSILVTFQACRRERGHWAVYYTSPQSFIITFSYSLHWQLWRLLNFCIGWFIKLSVQTPTEGKMLCIINEESHQFNGYCLIPLYHWVTFQEGNQVQNSAAKKPEIFFSEKLYLIIYEDIFTDLLMLRCNRYFLEGYLIVCSLIF